MAVLRQSPPNNIRHLNIYPTQEELLGARYFFRKNIIDGSFQNVEHYLDVQFRLLREDFVANLREAIEMYRSKGSTNDIKVYKNVGIFWDKNRNNETCLKIQNSSPNEDKCFMNGSLLIFFIKDNLQNMFLAKVVQKNVERGEVTISLVDREMKDIVFTYLYTVIECSKYFDPYFQVLTALQNISPQKFPMEKYIVYADTSSVYMPQYLHYSRSSFEIDGYYLLPEMLPHIKQNLLGLNNAQFEAFKAALIQEFVVIQGPPGTGKSHLGNKIATTLIKNSHFWYRNSPLLIVSYKNDSLDQFLEGLIPVTNRLVRVGGQSKSDKLKKYNLTNDVIRKDGKRPPSDYLRTMQSALVVGMTTSIAARWKDHLENLKSPIVIVEEAAEILEAHVVAALTNSCQHLILIGDHQQLQPLSADHNVAKNCHLGISLFERMVRNKVQHYQLKTQHRMRPEISDLLKVKIYPFLEDHESVKNRPSVTGVDKNVFFIDHNHPEETCNSTTKKNSFEAHYLLAFARYLVLNGCDQTEIVILATYAAQMQEIENLAQKDGCLKGVKISTLDGFQGQESNIVLLSLVRSDGIGFLAKENRVCVALSRAKNGFYLMGNMTMLSKNSNLWRTVKKSLEKQGAIGSKLSLHCQNHKTLTEVESLDDFWKVQNGGCNKKCCLKLSCGHECCLLCHNGNIDHQCEKRCLRTCGKTKTSHQAVASSLWQRPNNIIQHSLRPQEQNFISWMVDSILGWFNNLLNSIF